MTTSATPPVSSRVKARTRGVQSQLRASLLLRPRDGDALATALTELALQQPAARAHCSEEEFARRHGASEADLQRVREFARAHRLAVTNVNPAGRWVELAGTPGQFADAFAVHFRTVDQASQSLLRPTRPVAIPAELKGVVEGVFGLDELPLFHRPDRDQRATARTPAPARGERRSSTVSNARTRIEQVIEGYQFPKDADGDGQTIALILLGGGFLQSDMDSFFGEGKPEITVIELDGAGNNPAPISALHEFMDGLATGKHPDFPPELRSQVWWTLEATVDVQLLGSFAPGARLVVYFAPNDEKGKIDALTAAITNPAHRPAVISCSWGMREADARPDFVTALDRIFQMAATLGISICYSSGDHGADVDEAGNPCVHFPASSPHVLACGGTKFQLPAADPKKQVAWDESRGSTVLATGGGFSRHFPLPAWQAIRMDTRADAQVRGRSVPDVAGKADYASGYICLLAGRGVLGGGTSVAAPLWAALLARLSQKLGTRVGWLTPLLYTSGLSSALEDTLHGENDLYQASQGWDACTGLGTPFGDALLRALSS